MPIEIKVWRCSGIGCSSRRRDKNLTIKHEKTCWKVPANKTCLTCKHQEIVHDSDGSGWEDIYRSCRHKDFDEIHGDAFDFHNRPQGQKLINPRVNCPIWE